LSKSSFVPPTSFVQIIFPSVSKTEIKPFLFMVPTTAMFPFERTMLLIIVSPPERVKKSISASDVGSDYSGVQY